PRASARRPGKYPTTAAAPRPPAHRTPARPTPTPPPPAQQPPTPPALSQRGEGAPAAATPPRTDRPRQGWLSRSAGRTPGTRPAPTDHRGGTRSGCTAGRPRASWRARQAGRGCEGRPLVGPSARVRAQAVGRRPAYVFGRQRGGSAQRILSISVRQ